MGGSGGGLPFLSSGGVGAGASGGSGRPLAPFGAYRSGRHRYRLRGVVAHVGTSDSGHYYSFIRVGVAEVGGCTLSQSSVFGC